MWSTETIRQGMDTEINALYVAKEKAWQSYKGRTATAETPSHAFVASPGVTLSYLGVTTDDFLKAEYVSVAEGKFNKPAGEIFKRLQAGAEQDGINLVSRLRSGAIYGAGPYQNKQLSNWKKKGQLDLMVANAFSLYRTPEWEEIRPRLLSVIEDEYETARNVLGRVTDKDTADYYIIAGKPPDTGVGYHRFWKDRAALADALAKGQAQHVLEHDMEVALEGQLAIWNKWPYQSVRVEGFLGWSGSYNVSRSDADVTAVSVSPDGTVRMEISAKTRMANISPISWSSNAHAIPRNEQQQKMAANNSAGYILPGTKDVLANVFLYPPVTATFAHECSRIAIDADWGYSWPPPLLAGDEKNWSLSLPKELYKSGADAMIGLGSYMVGVGNIINPEWASGRPGTRRGYQIFCDALVSTFLRKYAVNFTAASMGDDQVIIVDPTDVPTILRSVLAPYLRLKGSDRNWTFRWGKTMRWISPDEVEIFTMPRLIKTSTTASVLAKGTLTADMLNFRIGETKALPLQEEALASAAKTWELAPDVFYMRGDPQELSQRIISSEYQSALEDAILKGAIDMHTSLFLGGGASYKDEIEQEVDA